MVSDLAGGGQPFTPPLAAHMPCYLQDMDGPGGPLLAVPGSHRSAFGDRRVLRFFAADTVDGGPLCRE
jgi:hypothetical protein